MNNSSSLPVQLDQAGYDLLKVVYWRCGAYGWLAGDVESAKF